MRRNLYFVYNLELLLSNVFFDTAKEIRLFSFFFFRVLFSFPSCSSPLLQTFWSLTSGSVKLGMILGRLDAVIDLWTWRTMETDLLRGIWPK